MIKDPPEVSVLVPLFNKRDYVTDAIHSVISQKHPEIAVEVIVVDDCSTDDSYEIVEQMAHHDANIILSRNSSNRGTCHTRNRALELANAQYAVLLDADDTLQPDSIRSLYSNLRRHGDCVAAYGQVVASGKHKDAWQENVGRKSTENYDNSTYRVIEAQHMIERCLVGCGSGLLFDRNKVNSIRFDESLKSGYNDGCADWIFYMQLMTRGKFIECGATTVEYRILKDSQSQNIANMRRSHDVLISRVSITFPLESRRTRRKGIAIYKVGLFAKAIRTKNFSESLILLRDLLVRAPIEAIEFAVAKLCQVVLKI